MARDRAQRDVLVVDRRRRNESADHRRDLWRPHAGGVDDDLGVDRAGVGQHATNLMLRRELEAGDPDTLPDPDAERPRGIGQRMRRLVGVEMAVTGEVDGTVQILGSDRREEYAGLVGPDHVDVEADPARPARRPPQLAELFAR